MRNGNTVEKQKVREDPLSIRYKSYFTISQQFKLNSLEKFALKKFLSRGGFVIKLGLMEIVPHEVRS